MNAARTQAITLPSRLAPGLPPLADTILMRLLAKQPDHRYKHAADVVARRRRGA